MFMRSRKILIKFNMSPRSYKVQKFLECNGLFSNVIKIPE